MIINNVSLPFFFSKDKVACSLSIVNSNKSDLSWLSSQELVHYHEIQSEKRKLHYVLGRTAAKHAITCADSRYIPQKISITNSNKGNPIVECGDYNVSISHSENYAVGLAFKNHEFSFGIDIEHFDKNRLSALKYITSENEPIVLDEKNLTIAWSMKESLSKALLCGFNMPFESFFIEKINLHGNIYISEYKHHPEYKSIAMLLWNFAIAITYETRLNVNYSQMQETLKNLII